MHVLQHIYTQPHPISFSRFVPSEFSTTIIIGENSIKFSEINKTEELNLPVMPYLLLVLWGELVQLAVPMC